MRGLVILVEFPGTPHKVDRAFVEERFFGKMNRYVQEMSYDRVCIGGEVTPRWYRLPHPLAHYRISSRNLEVDKTRIKSLINDVFNAVEPDVDVSAYDFIAFMLGAQQQEYGMIGLCAYPGMPGWQADRPLRTRDGKPVRGVAIFSYQAHLGTLFHDVAHVIGGVMADGKRAVPCLYDHDLQARPGPLRETFVDAVINMGFWDPMSCHYYKRDAPPPGISSWTKLRLGWLPDDKVAVVRPGETREILLGPLEDGRSGTLAIRIPLSATTYYLVENRQPIGFDRVLPGSGMLNHARRRQRCGVPPRPRSGKANGRGPLRAPPGRRGLRPRQAGSIHRHGIRHHNRAIGEGGPILSNPRRSAALMTHQALCLRARRSHRNLNVIPYNSRGGLSSI